MIKTTELWTFVTSIMGLIAFGQSLIHTFLPQELRMLLGSLTSRLTNRLTHWLSVYTFVDIPEVDGVISNELYNAIKLHLSTSTSLSAQRFKLTRPADSNTFTYSPGSRQWIPETFDGTKVWWEHHAPHRQQQQHDYPWRHIPEPEKRYYVLKIHHKDRDRVLIPYLEHILEHARELQRLNRHRLLYTNSRGLSWDSRSQPWESVQFKHPSTFETLALDPQRKAQIMADLQSFVKGQQFYQKTGRAWKRGYLLYGPPGTGKSSMIAAMSNYLGYDVYDLELTEVHSNAKLRKLLIRTTKKSIIVIEDIDCSLDFNNRGKKPRKEPEGDPDAITGKSEQQSTSMTLSGLLNFTDGLWSCCGSERIFVFTTNHIEKLDPALLRSGRMDMHICMSYCTFPAFKILVMNYLGLEDHYLFSQVEQIIDDAHMTPADVSEILLKNRDCPNTAMEDLLAELKAARERPWPPPLKEESKVDAEEEKLALEEKKFGEGDKGVQFVKCKNCERAEK